MHSARGLEAVIAGELLVVSQKLLNFCGHEDLLTDFKNLA
jgi:hypothetical protein